MALSLIGVGTTANDGTGDPLRTAFQTVNTALAAVNNAVVVGTGVTTFKDDSGTYGVAVASNGDVTFTNAGASVGMTWDASANGNAGAIGLETSAPVFGFEVNKSLANIWQVGSNVRVELAATTGTLDIATGSGLIILNTTIGEVGVFLVGGGNTTMLGSTSTEMVDGTPTNGEIGIVYTGSTYQIQNKIGTVRNIAAFGLGVRTSN